jgi:hypothetical protein
LDAKGQAILETLAHSKPPGERKSWTMQMLADQFVPVVMTLVRDLLMQSGNLPDCLVPAGASLPASGHPPLGDPQFGKRLAQPVRVVVKLTGAGGQQGLQPQVDPDGVPNAVVDQATWFSNIEKVIEAV